MKNSKPIRLEGKKQEIHKKLQDITSELERKFSKKLRHSYTASPLFLLAFGLNMLFWVLTYIVNFTYVIGVILSFALWAFVLAYLKYPKKLLTTLKPVVTYDTLKEIIETLPKYFRDEKIIITIYTDYKTDKIIGTLLKNSRTISLFGKEFLKISDKRIECEFVLKKWKIEFPQQSISLQLKHKVRIVSELIRKSGKRKDTCKTFLKTYLIFIRFGNKKSQRIAVLKKKKKSSRIPAYVLTESNLHNSPAVRHYIRDFFKQE